jgi:hypothetical protein
VFFSLSECRLGPYYATVPVIVRCTKLQVLEFQLFSASPKDPEEIEDQFIRLFNANKFSQLHTLVAYQGCAKRILLEVILNSCINVKTLKTKYWKFSG